MQLNLFNGGLSTRVASHLVGPSEALIYKNIDPATGPLIPIKDDTFCNNVLEKSFYYFNSTWVHADEDRDFIEFQSKLYYSNGVDIPQKSSDGLLWQNLGIAKPLVAPTTTIVPTGLLTGTYKYCYTYYNSLDGTESMPSIYSADNVLDADSVTIDIVASLDTQVTNIKLYRLGGDITVMSLVTTLANTTASYTDNTIDTAIEGSVLTSNLNGQAQAGLKYLTEANAMFFGAIADKLYFSDIAYVNSWSPYNFIDFDAYITGIKQAQNGILVFTLYKTYIITGTTPIGLSKYLLSSNQGCLLHKSIQYANNTLIWLSYDGVCSSTGSTISIISRSKLGSINITPICSVVKDDIYYLAHTNGVLVVDFRFTLVFRELTNIVQGFHYSRENIYFTNQDKKLYTLSTEEVPKVIQYKSPIFSDGAISSIKNYKSLYVNATGNLTFTTYINGVNVLIVDLTSGVQEIKLPQDRRLGYNIQFEVTGLGSILEIEYKVEGRQNGR